MWKTQAIKLVWVCYTHTLGVQDNEVQPSAFASDLILLNGGTVLSFSPKTVRNL